MLHTKSGTTSAGLSGKRPGLLADMTAFQAQATQPQRLVQIQGTGCTLNSTSVTASKQTNRQNNLLTGQGQNHYNLTPKLTLAMNKLTHGCERKHHVALPELSLYNTNNPSTQSIIITLILAIHL